MFVRQLHKEKNRIGNGTKSLKGKVVCLGPKDLGGHSILWNPLQNPQTFEFHCLSSTNISCSTKKYVCLKSHTPRVCSSSDKHASNDDNFPGTLSMMSRIEVCPFKPFTRYSLEYVIVSDVFRKMDGFCFCDSWKDTKTNQHQCGTVNHLLNIIYFSYKQVAPDLLHTPHKKIYSIVHNPRFCITSPLFHRLPFHPHPIRAANCFVLVLWSNFRHI